MLALLYTGKLNDDNKRRKLNATLKKKKNKNIVDRNASQYKKKKQKCVKSIWVLIYWLIDSAG